MSRAQHPSVRINMALGFVVSKMSETTLFVIVGVIIPHHLYMLEEITSHSLSVGGIVPQRPDKG